MTDRPGLNDVVLAAAKTIFDGSDEEWDEMDQETRDQFMSAALRAIMIHDDWLAAQGFKVIPPGAVQSPTTGAEAVTMLRAAKAFLEAPANKPKRKLIVPSGIVLGRTQ
jgi:hypothetical protein